MTALFSAEDLTTASGETVSEASAALAERVVWGWLQGPAGLDDRPDPLPAEMFSWALELGLIFLANPDSKTRRKTGETEGEWGARKAEILEAVRNSRDGGAAKSGPQGSFPPGECWPDPALAYGAAYYTGSGL